MLGEDKHVEGMLDRMFDDWGIREMSLEEEVGGETASTENSKKERSGKEILRLHIGRDSL